MACCTPRLCEEALGVSREERAHDYDFPFPSGVIITSGPSTRPPRPTPRCGHHVGLRKVCSFTAYGHLEEDTLYNLLGVIVEK
ncbi:unnamed protein product [Protopolystoma xenopodis]|uniref:Uncharacterized protein n=1 Tax=Protopolystoma xenopodis TaxID=117903 RepID=A0A3S5B413_9PLAT|nr:unnamed protein product [Protopolystoma xenopodis]